MMKYISAFAIVLCLASCSKETNNISVDQIEERADEVQSSWNLNAYVSYADHYAATCEQIYMEDVQVNLIEGNMSLADFSTDRVVMSRKTDQSGKAILESLDQGDYTLYVSTIYGEMIKHCSLKQGVNPVIRFELTK